MIFVMTQPTKTAAKCPQKPGMTFVKKKNKTAYGMQNGDVEFK